MSRATIYDIVVLDQNLSWKSEWGYSEVDSLFDEALEGQELKLGRDHPETLQTINDLGVLRREQQRYEEAESLLCEAL